MKNEQKNSKEEALKVSKQHQESQNKQAHEIYFGFDAQYGAF